VRRHTVVAVSPDLSVVRVQCDYCGSLHNFRGGGAGTGAGAPGDPMPLVTERESGAAGAGEVDVDLEALERMIRRVVREESGLSPVRPADKWRGGELVLKPGREGVQEKSWPIETFFHKVVMLRNRLRVLEQQVNGADEIPLPTKLKLQGYITGCYGSLTSFNVLFADDEDRFKGSGE
jgi:hypothetical protein